MKIFKDKRGMASLWAVALTMIVILLGILVVGLVVQYTDDLLPTDQAGGTGDTAFLNATLPAFTNALGNTTATMGQLFRLMIIIPLVGIIAIVMGAFYIRGARQSNYQIKTLRDYFATGLENAVSKIMLFTHNRAGNVAVVWGIVASMIIIVLAIIVSGFVVTVIPTDDLPNAFLWSLGNASTTFGQLFRLMIIVPLVTIIAVVMGAFYLKGRGGD